ncbi:MAG: hypothetical protein WDM78_06315 [Puia sp.]
MKKLAFLLFISACLIFCSVKACPICGCGGGNLYVGCFRILNISSLVCAFTPVNIILKLVSDPSQFSTNDYSSVEIWGGLRLGKKFQLLAFVPYYMNKQVDDDGTTYTHGLGDITVMGQYQVFKSSGHSSAHNSMNQQLWMGGGIKLPTGPFNANMLDSNTTIADINAQIGTGSVDFLINGMYGLTVRNFGLNLSASYKINTVNAQNYKYGNKFQTNLIASYHLGKRMTSTIPNIGVGYENVAINKLGAKRIQYTGSQILTAIAGVEIDFGKIGVGINGQIPLAQNFAEGQTKMRFNGMMHITFQL